MKNEHYTIGEVIEKNRHGLCSFRDCTNPLDCGDGNRYYVIFGIYAVCRSCWSQLGEIDYNPHEALDKANMKAIESALNVVQR